MADLAKAIAEVKLGLAYDGTLDTILNAVLSGDLIPVQCCMCGKTGLSVTEDGGPECELPDGRWVCSGDCWDKASALQGGDMIPLADHKLAVAEAYRRVVEEVGRIDPNTLEGREDLMRRVVSTILALADTDALAEVHALRAERDGWMETANMHHNAEQAFLSWLRAAGEHMRAEGITVCDDGQDSGDILAAKVPECAALLKARAEAAEAELAATQVKLARVVEECKYCGGARFTSFWGIMIPCIKCKGTGRALTEGAKP